MAYFGDPFNMLCPLHQTLEALEAIRQDQEKGQGPTAVEMYRQEDGSYGPAPVPAKKVTAADHF